MRRTRRDARARAVAIGLLVASSFGVAMDARAVCGRPPAAYVSPEPGAAAPTNTHVRVRMHKDWTTVGFCAPAAEGHGRCPPGTFDLALVRAPSSTSVVDEIPVVRRDSLSHEMATIDLAPRTPLMPRQRYEVLAIDRGGVAKTHVLGTFTTGDARDDA